ncbi:MAG: ABC transporter ATP-binding protein [Acidobacteria bacterium]|nr:ABC transporter ATP-binding protein [Acidobacteriota bacterium]
MNVVALRNVSFAYNGARIVDDLSFGVEAGAFVGLVGPNGAGKTTILRLMQGLLRPSSGNVELEERDLASFHRNEIALRIAGVWQRPPLAFGFTAKELVLLGRTPHLGLMKWETPHDHEIAEEVMRQTETLHLAERTAMQMSAGELQRVFIASALAQRSRILLLDEPTSFLDLRQAARLSKIIGDLMRCGMTIVCASHDLALIRRHASKVIVIRSGRLHYEGSPDDALERARLAEAFGMQQEDWYHEE